MFSSNLNSQPITIIPCAAKMWRKILFSAFLAVLLVQSIVSVPAPSAEDDDCDCNEVEHGSTGSKKQGNAGLLGSKNLELVINTNLTTLLNFQLSSTYQIAKDVLADPAISSVDTEDMRHECRILSNYVKEAKVAADAHQTSDKTDNGSVSSVVMGKGLVLEQFQEYARNHNADARELNDAQKLIWEALLRHGYLDLWKEIQQRGKVFAVNLADAVLQYVDSLSPAEKEKKAELVELCQEYNRHKSHDNKVIFGLELSDKLIALERL